MVVSRFLKRVPGVCDELVPFPFLEVATKADYMSAIAMAGDQSGVRDNRGAGCPTPRAADGRPFVAPALKRLRRSILHGVMAAADRVFDKWRQPPCRSAAGSWWPLAAERVIRWAARHARRWLAHGVLAERLHEQTRFPRTLPNRRDLAFTPGAYARRASFALDSRIAAGRATPHPFKPMGFGSCSPSAGQLDRAVQLGHCSRRRAVPCNPRRIMHTCRSCHVKHGAAEWQDVRRT